MRLMRVGEPGLERPAVEIDGGVFDVSADVSEYDRAFWEGDGLDRLAGLVESGDLPPVADGVRVGAPIPTPSKVVCVGLNYRDHAREAGADIPTEPIIFFKAPNTVVGPQDDVLIPPGSEKTDWEVELAVVIGARCRYLRDEADAAGRIAGYAISNDVSERAYQMERGGQWVKGKSCETFNPLGPVLVTADDVADPQALAMRLAVNGVERQASSTAEMIFGVHHLVWYLSQFMVLEPGDLVNTGTPAGVGLGFDPPVYLRAGDVMELSIDGLGSQRQVCRDAQV
ncbi:MAG TPA: fumarylacetoacetate hydrolase family protein [Acidimicrobiia bacterium]|nr:fumarylacetoacetate hydrolase family protein [Acidimicrobiia bacterium]